MRTVIEIADAVRKGEETAAAVLEECLAEVAARNARLSASPESPVARLDWIWNHDVASALADG